MQAKNVSLLPRLLLALAVLFFGYARADAQSGPTARITQAIDEKNLVVLKGNVHPLAAPQHDQGAVSDALPLRRILLLLQRGPDQEAALDKFLEDQQDKSSPNYHAWLTPQQFGQQFGPADADIQTVTNWLKSHGFQITNVTAGRTLIEFSGTAGQVKSAFHTEIHNYLVNAEVHTANVTDPQIPAALAPVVVGPVSLNSFPIPSHIRQLGTFYRAKGSSLAKPLFTSNGCTPAGCFGLGPADFATIYNSAPLLSGTPKIDGTGQTIAIVGESDIDPTDVTDFQTMFGMTPNFSSANNIIVNGADPGINGSEGESDLDVQWAGAVAPGATVKFVTSQPTETTAGIFLSAVYIVENNFAGVMSESFGGCEQQIGNLNQFHNTLWQQAAAQGITVVLSAGDGGSAGCDNFDTAQAATQGLGVSGFASTPYNIAVGGTDLDEINRWSQFWSSTNSSPSESSALSYIPEIPWNDSCAQLGINGCGASAPNGSLNIVAGSGGGSTLYSKPSWQSGMGVPMNNQRFLPDVSLFASNGFDGSFYIICQRDATRAGSCNLSNLGFTFLGVGGTSASAPAFAGIMALVNQSQMTAQNPAPRQGNANYVLYPLFKKQTSAAPAINCNSSATPSTSCTFYDVTQGNSALSGIGTNSVPCTPGSPSCSSSTLATADGVLVTTLGGPQTEAYTATAGYDLATGLGSVNIANLVKNWSSVTSLPSTTTLIATVNGQPAPSISGITHGTPVSLTSTVAAGQGANGTPSGQVALLATPNPNASAPAGSLSVDVLALSSGTATGTNVVLPGGQYNLTAHYQGDGTFGSSDSTPPISVSISAEPSKTLISIPTFDPNTGAETGNTPTSFIYGTPYIARIDVGNAQATLSFPPVSLCTAPNCPTGSITWTDSLNGAAPVPLDGGTFPLNSQGFTEDQIIQLSPGSYVLNAAYSGDSSYNKGSAAYSLTVTLAPTSFTIQPFTTNTAVVGSPFQILVTGNAQTPLGASPTGTVTFFDGGTPVGSPVAITGAPGQNGASPAFRVVAGVTLATGGGHTLTAQYSGDANYAPSSSAALAVNVFYPTSVTATVTPSTINLGQSVNVTAVISTKVPSSNAALKPTGAVTFGGPSGPLPNIPVNLSTAADASGNWEITATITDSPQQPGLYFVTYAGDSNYLTSQGFSNVVNVILPDFSMSPSPSLVAIVAGQSGASTLTLTPATNLNSTVNLTCDASTFEGVTCALSPAAVNLTNSAAATSTLSVTVAGPSNGTTAVIPLKKRGAVWFASLGTGGWTALSCTLFLALLVSTYFSMGKRLRWTTGLIFTSVVVLAFGCGGGSANSVGGGGGGGGGPVPTSTTVTVTSTKVAAGSQFTLTANITSAKTVTGTVDFFDVGPGGSGLGVAPPVAVVNGMAQTQATLNLVGAHQIVAQYSGDGQNQPSQSGSLSVVATGTSSVQVTAKTGVLLHVVGVQITVQ